MGERTNQEWLDALRGLQRDEALVDLYAILVRGLGYALAKYKNVRQADIEDFAQDALLKIIDALDSFRGESRFTTWANKIAVRVAFTELRRRRWQNVSLESILAKYEGDFTPAMLADRAPSPERVATQDDLLAILKRLIAEELTDRQRQAVIAVILEGMPLEEVARQMDSNRNAMYKLIHDARKRLKQRLQAEGLEPKDVLAAFEQ